MVENHCYRLPVVKKKKQNKKPEITTLVVTKASHPLWGYDSSEWYWVARMVYSSMPYSYEVIAELSGLH